MKYYDNNQSKIHLGRREGAEKGVNHNWTDLTPYEADLTQPTILVFGGNITDNSEFANGNAKCVESLLDEKTRKNTQILSFMYKNEPISTMGGMMSQDYLEELHKIYNALFKPLLYDRAGRMKEKQGIEKIFRKLIFVAHCGGSNFVNRIIDDFYLTLLEKYPPATAEILVSKIQYFAYAPNQYPNHEVNSLFINPYIDTNHSWSRMLNLFSEQRVDTDYPKGLNKELSKPKYRDRPGACLEEIFKTQRAVAFKHGQSIYLIPSRMNPDRATGDHSIDCITKSKIINSESEYAETAQIANKTAKLFLNLFASETPIDHKSVFTQVSNMIYDSPQPQQREF